MSHAIAISDWLWCAGMATRMSRTQIVVPSHKPLPGTPTQKAVAAAAGLLLWVLPTAHTQPNQDSHHSC